MRIDISMQQKCPDNTLSRQVTRRVRFALSRFGTAIRIITIRFTDINGPGGLNTQCAVSVKLASGGEVVAQGQGSDVLSALTCCLPRVGRTINRDLERRRDTAERITRPRRKLF